MTKMSELTPEKKKKAIQFTLLCTLIFAITYLIYFQYGRLLGRTFTTLTYWDVLAKSLLHGKLYLIDTATTFDLSSYMGHWYVPKPPLPALLMLPVVFLTGGVDPILFSIFFSAINCVLIFVLLDQASHLGWIKISRGGIIWLVLLFAFGTPHWWVGMDGRVWFVSQIVAVTFIALAVLCALKSWSPWLAGACLGAAIISRPTVVMIWPFLFAIVLQLTKDKGEKYAVRPLAGWAIKSLVPIGLAVAGLLVYNYLCFHNFLDFGYATLNSSPRVVQDVQTYGMFNGHFIPLNLYVMFLTPPTVVSEIPYLLPSVEGMSMLLTTPAFVYLFHRYEKQWWVVGAWTSVILSVGILAFYSNTGAYQFGYRYILDFIVPLILLLATTIQEKTSRLFIILVMISILINQYGAWWFIRYFSG
jgi:hypothetical protein